MTVEQREYCKKQLQNYVESITEHARGSRTQYNCPISGCGSGTGKKRTGAFSIKGTRYKCFSCGSSGDVFDLISVIEGIRPNSREVFKRAEELFNIDRDRRISIKEKADRSVQSQKSEKQIRDYSKYIKQCAEAVKNSPIALEYLTKTRGLSPQLIERYNIGYDANYSFINSKGKESVLGESIIIPYPNENYYIVRPIEPPLWFNGKYKKLTETIEPLFNYDILYADSLSPLFVVEGQFDALSILDVGADAIALNSTTGITKLIQKIKDNPIKRTLILSFDNDEAGQKATRELAIGLDKHDVAYIVANVSGEYNDPNEAITKGKENFIKVVQETMSADKSSIIKHRKIVESSIEEYIKTNSITTYLNQFIQKSTANKGLKGISTGFKGLDDIFDGGLYAGLYVVGAVSSLGKTTVCLQIADAIAVGGTDVFIFSLEIAKKELISKSLSRISYSLKSEMALSTRQILNGEYNDYIKDSINNSYIEYKKFTDRIFISEGLGTIGTEQIRETVNSHIKATGNKPVVFIDYLQILSPSDPRMNDKQNMDKSVLELKRISRDIDIPIVAISSLNRDNYSKTINMAAFKESGLIEYSSDVLIGLQFKGIDEKDKDEVDNFINDAKCKEIRQIELKILKNRNGATGSVLEFEYNPKFNIFIERKTEKMVASKFPSRKNNV